MSQLSLSDRLKKNIISPEKTSTSYVDSQQRCIKVEIHNYLNIYRNNQEVPWMWNGLNCIEADECNDFEVYDRR